MRHSSSKGCVNSVKRGKRNPRRFMDPLVGHFSVGHYVTTRSTGKGAENCLSVSDLVIKGRPFVSLSSFSQGVQVTGLSRRLCLARARGNRGSCFGIDSGKGGSAFKICPVHRIGRRVNACGACSGSHKLLTFNPFGFSCLTLCGGRKSGFGLL